MRPTWDEYFMKISHSVKDRSTCIRRQVGAILVKGKQIVSTGYNDTPRGVKNCGEGGCERCRSTEENNPRGTNLDKCACSHAEENAIVQAALHGISSGGSILYTTNSPCTICAKMLINAGVTKIILGGDYPDELGVKLLKEANVEIVKFPK